MCSAPGERQPPRVATRANDEPSGGQTVCRIVQLDGVRIDKTRRADTLINRHPELSRCFCAIVFLVDGVDHFCGR